MRISAYAKKPHICGKTAYAHMKSQLKCATRSINDFENIHCTNCECSFMLSDDLIPHNLLVYALTYAVRKRHAHNAHFRIYQYADHAQICRKPQPHRRIYAWNRIIRNRMANSSRESLRNGWWYQKKINLCCMLPVCAILWQVGKCQARTKS